MSDNERVERLARLLTDHECWEHPGWGDEAKHTANPQWRARQIRLIDDCEFAARGNGSLWYGAACVKALDAAIYEVDSGAVMGAPVRCCICGRPEATHWTASFYHPHYACHRSDNPECADAWSKAYEDSPSDNGPDETIRTILRARKILRHRKAKPARNPVREWGMEWPGKAGVLGSPHEYQPDTLRRWRDRLRAGKIRAEVPERKPSVAFREAVNRGTKAPPPWPFPCYPVTAEPVSGNPRGDGFLRDLWREDEKRTEVLRRLEALRGAQIGMRIVLDEHGRSAVQQCNEIIALARLGKEVRSELDAVRELAQGTAADLLEHVQASKPKAKAKARKGGKR